MPFDLPTLLDALNSVTTIPIIPFKDGQVDYAGHAKNIRYLMQNNYLDNKRPRVISIAGTSLIHHLSLGEQTKVMVATAQEMGSEGVMMSGIVPNSLTEAGQLIKTQSQLDRAPDCYLLMPLSGVASPDGIYETYMQFGEEYGSKYGARFLYYFRQQRDLAAVIKLMNDSPHFIGVKVGTGETDVPALVEGVGDSGIVMWGIGDRCTRAAELGCKGHTSGISVVVARAGDEINNAQRKGDYDTSRQIEAAISALEEIRFRNGREYNYSAVIEAMHLIGADDIEGGAGGPFNPRVPAKVAEEVAQAVAGIKQYH